MRLTFAALSCGYGRTPVLTDLSFTLRRGLWLITGPNGSGKSTLMRCAVGLLPPIAGRLLWDGADAYRLAERYRWHLGYAPQETGGSPDMPVRAYLHYLAALKGILPARRAARVNEVITIASLTEVADRPVPDLSGGLQQRMGLAQALLNDPDLLLLDEPAVSLDPEERVRFRQLLLDLSADRIVLTATNLPDELDGMASGIIRLSSGRAILTEA